MFGAASIKILAGSAAVAGFVWARQALRGRVRETKAGAARGVGVEPTASAPGREGEARASDDVALAEALRDIREMRARRLADLERDTRNDPDDVDLLELGASVGHLDRVTMPDEPYDALDAEDLGTEWLLRATQASPTGRQDASELFEGAHAIVSEIFVDDAALPVGNVDAQGNTELHAPTHPPDAFRAPPTGELAVSEKELAGRNAPPGPPRR